MPSQVKLIIIGHVQGVFYRAEAQEQAKKLGLKGYAKNNRDGSVTVVAVGKEAALEKFIAWCKQGPDSCKVDKVELAYEPPETDQEFTNFEIH